ncbi:unnamed protein product [Clonostachys solani]|uniref:Uncharacterized protein n=1 Tax=Clonostachys solani TaxID=160281 RepID=A0A9N9Z098_9HYPO|nr:unnamed protein product [Clonostachys solani]
MLALAPLLLLAVRPAVASFNLDTVVTDYWYYVHNHLAASTSKECLAAYSATIDCDQTLLGMVSSGSPNFNPDLAAVESMCSTTCKDSLDSYVENVKKACTASGDGALLSSTANPRPQVPVQVVGEVFQYEYAWSCSKNSTGWCYFNWGYGRDPYYARSDFPCNSGCSIKFMETAHDYPGSHYVFMTYTLSERSSWWENVFEEGWETVQECRKNGDSDTSSAVSQSRTTSGTDMWGWASTSNRRSGLFNGATTRTQTATASGEESGPTQTVTQTHENTVTQQVTVTAPSGTSSNTSGGGKTQPAGAVMLAFGIYLSIFAVISILLR